MSKFPMFLNNLVLLLYFFMCKTFQKADPSSKPKYRQPKIFRFKTFKKRLYRPSVCKKPCEVSSTFMQMSSGLGPFFVYCILICIFEYIKDKKLEINFL
jgi:hypothetical protein